MCGGDREEWICNGTDRYHQFLCVEDPRLQKAETSRLCYRVAQERIWKGNQERAARALLGREKEAHLSIPGENCGNLNDQKGGRG